MIYTETTVRCDGCGYRCPIEARHAAPRAAREYLRTRGWTRRKGMGEMLDLCPACASLDEQTLRARQSWWLRNGWQTPVHDG